MDFRWRNKNVFHTLVNGGRDGKGMISWKGTLKPKEMQKVASYILSLKVVTHQMLKLWKVWVEERVLLQLNN
jgi:cytochrome c oxidase cbb3-type subunit 3